MSNQKPKRQSTRFPAAEGTIARIDMVPDHGEFTPTINALLIDEAQKGCSFVVMRSQEFKEKQEIRIQYGALAALKAEIRWVKNIDERVNVIGVLFLE